MRIGSKLVLILLLFPFTCLAQVKGKVVSVSDSTSMPSANFSLEKELKDVVVVADMVSRNASKETIFITDSLRKGTVSAIQLGIISLHSNSLYQVLWNILAFSNPSVSL